MDTKSTVAKRSRKNHYVTGSSRKARSVTTLLAQVEDIERGQRIKARREDLRLTQPAVVDLVERLAYELPADHALHPNNAGKAPLTLRGYQQYERGGGIVWEKAKLLASALRMEADELMNGEKGDTPDPFAGQDQAADLADLREQLDRIETRLEEIYAARSQQAESIIERLDRLEAALNGRVDGLESTLAESAARAGRELRASSPRPKRAVKARAPKRNPAA